MSLAAWLDAQAARWFRNTPASEPEVIGAETVIDERLPSPHRELLLTAGGASVYGAESRIVLIPAHHLWQFDHPELVIFGDDEGDYFYCYDRRDVLGRGAWAIFVVAKSSTSLARAKYVARDLRELFARIIAGDAVLDG